MKTDEERTKEFLEKGVESIFPNKEFLEKRLKSGEKLSMYLGIDPTGPNLHLGHMSALLKLKQFQELGHQVVLLIGDFTAMIGDPTGKDKVRKTFTREEILENSKKYKEQAERFISFNGENPAVIKHNSEWLSKMTFEEILEGLSNLTVDQMLKRDMFQRRQKEGNPIFIHEFLYPFMQGIDSVYMGVDGEIGGNDQTFNMLVGRDLMKTMRQKEKFVVATKLLTDPSGTKMGKTEGNMITLNQNPDEMYGGVMSFPDDLIIKAFEILTKETLEDIEGYKKRIEEGENPKEIKSILAKKIVGVNYSEEESEKAQKNFDKVFSGKEIPNNPTELSMTDGEIMSDLLIKNNILKSKTEFKRLIEQGGIKNLETGGVVNDFNYIPKKGEIFKVGKKDFIKIV